MTEILDRDILDAALELIAEEGDRAEAAALNRSLSHAREDDADVAAFWSAVARAVRALNETEPPETLH